MSEVTLRRIGSVLQEEYASHLDMSDYDNKPPEDRRKAMLSRALAALYIKCTARVDTETACQAVTDGYDDNGLDAIHFDQKTDTLLLVLSKWSDNGNKPIGGEGTNAFAKGIRDLLSERLENFNYKVRKK